MNFKDLHNAFDEDEPLPASDDVRYVDFSPVRADLSVVNWLVQAIEFAGDKPAYQLLRGHTKCGKTTELNRTARRLEEAGYVPVLFDVADVATRTFEYSAVLLIMAEQVVEQIKQRFSIDVRRQSEQQLIDFLREREVTQAISAEGGAELGGEAGPGSLLTGLLAKLGFNVVVRGSFQRSREITVKIEQDKPGFLAAIKRIVADADEQVKTAGHKGLVVICDGCDKLEIHATDEHGRQYDLQTRMFVDHGPDLQDIPCHVIYTAPISLQANVGNDWDGDDFVPAVPVNRIPGMGEDVFREGRRLLTEVVRRRVEQQGTTIEKLFAEPQLLEDCISVSGGHISDLLQIIRLAVRSASHQQRPQLERKDINIAIFRRKNEFTQLIRVDHLNVLREISEANIRPAASDEYRDIIFKRLALEYFCDGDVRVALHPMIASSNAFQRFLNPRNV